MPLIDIPRVPAYENASWKMSEGLFVGIPEPKKCFILDPPFGCQISAQKNGLVFGG